MYIYTFLLRMTDTILSRDTDLPSWNTLYTAYENTHGIPVETYRITALRVLTDLFNKINSILTESEDSDISLNIENVILVGIGVFFCPPRTSAGRSRVWLPHHKRVANFFGLGLKNSGK
jgi:hypothetical protein